MENSGSVEDDEDLAPTSWTDQSIRDQCNMQQTTCITRGASQVAGAYVWAGSRHDMGATLALTSEFLPAIHRRARHRDAAICHAAARLDLMQTGGGERLVNDTGGRVRQHDTVRRPDHGRSNG
jgi:hypothetical protein